MVRTLSPGEAYRRLLRGAVRYFSLGDARGLRSYAPELSEASESLWREFWWRDRSPLLVAGALCDANAHGSIELSPGLRRRLIELLHAGQYRYQILAKEWRTIANKSPNQTVPLKGLWLTPNIYPTIQGCATRLFSDLDIQVGAECLAQLEHVLRSLGYQRETVSKEQWRFIRDTGASLWTGLPLFERPISIPPAVLERGQRLLIVEVHLGLLDQRRFLKEPFCIASGDDSSGYLVHLCLHLVRHLFAHPYGLVDVALMVQHPLLDAGHFLTRVRQLGAEDVCSSVFGMVACVFGKDLLPPWTDALQSNRSYREGSRLAGKNAAMEAVPVVTRGSRLAWIVARRSLAYKYILVVLIRIFVPRHTWPRRLFRWVRRTWQSR